MSFNGIHNLRDAKESVKYQPWQLAEIKRCSEDPIYFINTYVYINTKDNGMQLFKTWPFQNEAIKRFLKYRFNINRWSRQVGKSTIVRGFILWHAMYHSDQLVAMLANKLSLAKEQLQLLRDSYVALPYWLQPGVKLWNKMSIQFSNNTRIIVAASSPDGIRGFSPNLLYLDEFAFLRSGMADEFMASVFPAISSGKKTRVIITSCVTKDTMVFTPAGIKTVDDFIIDDGRRLGYEVPDYQVLGRYGMNRGHIMHNDGHKATKVVETQYSSIECSLMHKFWVCRDGEYKYMRAHELKLGDYLMVRYGMNCWGNDEINYTHHHDGLSINAITPDLAYLFGLYISAGDINDQTLYLTIDNDISTLLRKMNLTNYKRDKSQYQIASTDIVDLFKFVGFNIKLPASQKEIPPRLMRMSKECTTAMIQGMMDGNGCTTAPRKRISYTSTSHKLIKQLRMLLLNFGILSAMVDRYSHEIGVKPAREYVLQATRDNPDHYDIIPFSAQEISRLKETNVLTKGMIELTDGLCGKGQQHLSRKLILDIKAQLPQDIINAEPVFQNAEPDFVWAPITKLTDSENDVFDFSLNDDNYGGEQWAHSVIYNGITGRQTPAGLNHFYRMWEDAVEESTASYHDLMSKYVKSTVLWSEVPGRDQQWGVDEMARIGEQKFRQEYECEFVGSAVTLIDYKILQKLKASKPIAIPNIPKDYMVRMFKRPENKQKMEVNKWVYVASIDSGYGIRKDYHVLQILLAKHSLDAEQVFVMSSNTVTIEDFCSLAYKILKLYGNPPLTIEFNGPGSRTYGIMFNQLDYENIVNYDNKLHGLWATNAIKQTAVMLLKLYVQRFYLKLHDEATITELMSFTQLTVNKWGGSGGNHDDNVTALYWAIYYMASEFFEGEQKEMRFMDGLELAFASTDNGDAENAAIEFMNDDYAKAEQAAMGALEKTSGFEKQR